MYEDALYAMRGARAAGLFVFGAFGAFSVCQALDAAGLSRRGDTRW